jgi:hypothetical protein
LGHLAKARTDYVSTTGGAPVQPQKSERKLLADSRPFSLREAPLPLVAADEIARACAVRRAVEESGDEQHYAWIDLPFELINREEIVEESDGALVAVDLCSAVPLFAARLEMESYAICLDESRAVVRQIHLENRGNRKVVPTGRGDLRPVGSL